MTSIIIVGGGVTGVTLALSILKLSNINQKIHIIEKSDASFSLKKNCNMVVIAENTYSRFEKINIWKHLLHKGYPVNNIFVKEENHTGFLNLNAKEFNTSVLGRVFNLDEINLKLFSSLKKEKQIKVHSSVKIKKIIRTSSSVKVLLENGRLLRGQLLIGADGSNSIVRKTCNIHTDRKNYHQIAVSATFKTSQINKGCAFEIFTHNGPLAVLPIEKKKCFLVWCHNIEHEEEITRLSEYDFCQKLQKTFGWYLGRITQVKHRVIYPISLIKASRFIGHRCVLIGNAAQTIHPVAGQGLNLGLRDAIVLSKVISQSVDPGSALTLLKYKSARLKDKSSIIQFTDGLIHLFSNKWLPLEMTRNSFILASGIFPFLKRLLINKIFKKIEKGFL